MQSIPDLLAGAGINYQIAPHRNVRRGWIGIDCPKCSPGTKKYRLGIELETGRAHCWVCGKSYLPDILSKILKISFFEAKQLTGKLPKYRAILREEHPSRNLLIPPGVGDLLEPHRTYLESRRLNPDTIADVWGVRGIGLAQRLSWRLWIPIHDQLGRIVSWTTRSIGKENKARYVAAYPNEEAVHHKRLLYGSFLARHTILIVEGPVDAWSFGQGAVATFGLSLTSYQKMLICEFPYRIVCFDNEPDARRRAEQLCNELCLMPGVTQRIDLQTGKDLNECDSAEVATIRQKYFPEISEIYSELPQFENSPV